MFVLDTNAISEIRKINLGKADARFANWAANVDADDLYLSVITMEELAIGVVLAELRDPARGAIFRKWLDDRVLTTFAERILMVDTVVARQSAKLHIPDPRPIRDALIAATALVHKMTIVTRNVCDFETTGVSILNPWSG
jgi:predicted nucleic acid-binding protein